MGLIFTVQEPQRTKVRKGKGTKSDFTLRPLSWDDFSYESSFWLEYNVPGSESQMIGTLKIIEQESEKHSDGKFRPGIPRRFSSLRPRFISLGQDGDYYIRLREVLGLEQAGELLTALADISWNPTLSIPFETSSPFRNSLTRSNSAQRARRAGRAIVLGSPIHDSPAFRYKAHIPGASAPLPVEVNFDGSDEVPGRIACIIGRNAVGKTQLLASLARDLTQITRKSRDEVRRREDRFWGGRPLFTRIIAVSYNAFDKFSRATSSDTGYVYCGLRNPKGVPSLSHLTAEYGRSIERVISSNRTGIWRRCLRRILGRKDSEFTRMLEKQCNRSASPEEFLDRLSSGEAVLTHLTTSLVSWLEPFSLILFDEPETHLHPNAVANLFNVLADLLSQHDSYALVATHSPIVLQEVPRNRVLVLSRDGRVPLCTPMEVESFGETISELTRHVFDTNEIPNLYKQTLSELAERESFEETLERFQNRLSQNARAYLLAKHLRKT